MSPLFINEEKVACTFHGSRKLLSLVSKHFYLCYSQFQPSQVFAGKTWAHLISTHNDVKLMTTIKCFIA